MRFTSFDCPAPNTAAACSAYEDQKAARTKMFQQDVDMQMGPEKMKIAIQPADWANNWTFDPTADLAFLYKQIALNFNDEAEIGRIVKRVFENKLRTVAEFIVGEQS